MPEKPTDERVEDEQEPDERGVALPERNVMSLLGGSSLFGSTLLDPSQNPLGSDPAAGTPGAGATDPDAGISSATENVASLAQTAQQADPGSTAQNIGSQDSVSSATTPPAEP